ncbi:MAG: hypothetical protein JWQ25_2162, partial [Daejeonella sp.]|nr:hypothetical protein [Daejeonella sp.]
KGFLFISVFNLLLLACKAKVPVPKETVTDPVAVSKPPVEGIRIAWDFSTRKKVSGSVNAARYSGYARLIELNNGSLMCVYEADGNIVTVKSIDFGDSWSEPSLVVKKEDGFNMSVPDILQLADQSILICYNPRPYANEPSKNFAIHTIKSYDNGLSWKDDRTLYEASFKFQDGCWEPAALQLPSGEIQLFFANEGVYLSSEEQNISLVRSNDSGLTWTKTPEIASFRAGRRDGMPSPLLLKNGKDIVFSIEDNGSDNFKPYIIKNAVSDNWTQTVSASSPNRTYALKEKIDNGIYAGAPYLRQLKTGETILSYQGTENRINKLENSEMKVVIGDENALDFNRKSVPFVIPGDKSALWSSVSVLNDNTVIALTSTNAYSVSGNTEIWMIKGHVIPEIAASESTIAVDGNQNEDLWKQKFPIFVGHNGATQLNANISYNADFLFIISQVTDKIVSTGSADLESNDGITFYIDPANKNYEKPDKNIFSFFVSANNQVTFKEGNAGAWSDKTATGIKSNVKISASGYNQEIAIPWSLIGGKPALNSRIGINLKLTENSGKSSADYKENISSNSDSQPFSWLTLKLK